MALFTPLARGADALKLDKNYFVTGDYTVAGVGLRGTGVSGWATGTITITGVPCTSGVGALTYESCSTPGAVASDIVAAFLYWETEETTQNSSASGYFDGNAISGAAIGNTSNPSCEGLNGAAGPRDTYGHVYRADVLPFLKVDQTNSIRLANGAHTVKLADSGKPNTLPYTNGASLVVVYKVVVPGNPLIAPLKAVVLYDGAYTMAKGSPAFTQTIGGFYQATGSGATMAQIVANGESSFAENLSVNGTVISTSPFTGKAGARWDNPAFGISLAPNAASYSTEVTSGNSQVCLTWAAVVTSTPVVDSDRDGLLDVWETNGIHLNTGTSTTPATFGGCSDYPADPCVNLPAMGTNPFVRDVFLQIDWMHGYAGEGTVGTDGSGNHDHKPTQNALNMVCTTFALHGIAIHFDVGNNYQGQPCIIPANDRHGNPLAQGGSDIPEYSLLCPNAATSTCTYTETYPVLSFKRGFISVRDGDPTLNLPAHFSHERKDSFHYVLFTHALAGPFGATGVPLTKDPTSVSGIADRPGGDVMVTLGLWRTDVPTTDQVGTDLIQAGTLMHELGHNFDLSHYGLNRTPNCAPEYPSVMNYLYQTRGLTDAFGNEHIDYSYGLVSPALSENSPTHFLFPLLYRIRYYAPLNSAVNTAGQAAKVFCSGASITNGALAIRLESSGLSAPDWSNGTGDTASPPLDLNFDGVFGQTFHDQPDWSSLNLQQVGGRPNANGASGDVGFADEGFADEGFADEGFADEGFADEGFADEGITDGDVDLNTNTLSGAPAPTNLTATNTINSIQLAWLPPSAGQVSYYDVYRCAVIAPATSCTQSTTPFQTAPGGTATPSFTDTVNDTTDSGAGGSAACSTSTCYNTTYTYQVTAEIAATVNNAVTMAESGATNTGTSEVTHLFVVGNSQTLVYGATALPIPNPTYTVYGDVSGSLTSGVTCAYAPSSPRNVGVYTIVCSGPATTSATDGVTYNAAYLSYTPGVLTITQRPITVTAIASSKVYDGTTSSPATPTITMGSLAYTDTVTWTETYDNRNVGTTHVMTPAGVVNDGNAGNNYKITFVTYTPGAIAVLPITVTPAASSKTYDGTTSPQPGIVPTIAPNLGAGDTPSFTEAYSTRNVGTTLLMTTAGTVLDGNNGNNYMITLATASVGTIYKLAITVTPAASSKTYDGTTSPQPGVVPTIAPNLGAGDTPSFTEAYSSKNAGTNLLMTTAGTVLDGNSGSNYTITLATANVGTIIRLAITVTPAASSKTYDGTTSPQAGIVPNFAPPLATGDSPSFTEAYSSKNAGTSLQMTTAGTVSDGNSGNNYAITLAMANVGTINTLAITVTPAASSKTYDATTSPQTGIIPTIAPPLATGDSPSFMEAYSSANVGTTLLMTTAGTVSDGNSGNNYTITRATASVGTIIQAQASVTPNASGKTYSMPDPTPLTTGTLSGFFAADNVTATYTRAPGNDAGMYTISAMLASTGLLTNYSITYNTAIFTILPASQSIMFSALSNQALGTADFSVTAMATSGLAVTFTATGNCTVTTAGLVHLFAAGSCNITASQAGSNDFTAAMNVSQSFTITDSFVINDFTTLTLLGSATAVAPGAMPSTLTLTNTVGQDSAAWFPTKQTVGNGFTTQFTFQITQNNTSTADGFAFVIQNSGDGTGALGGGGGFLGYQGLTNSLAVEFDTYKNDWDPNSNHVAVQSNYAAANTASHNSVVPGSATVSVVNDGITTNLSDGSSHTVIITYDGTSTLTVSLDGTQVLTAAVTLSSLGLDPGGNAVVGFTAASGSGGELGQIFSWSYTAN